MVFDITLIDSGETTRYKPRNKTTCRGILLYDGEEIASLAMLAIAYTESANLVSGRFELEWHRMAPEDQFTGGSLDLMIYYKERDLVDMLWSIKDIQLLYLGTVLAIQHLRDVIGKPVVFLGRKMETSID